MNEVHGDKNPARHGWISLRWLVGSYCIGVTAAPLINRTEDCAGLMAPIQSSGVDVLWYPKELEPLGIKEDPDPFNPFAVPPQHHANHLQATVNS
ncbi:MAG: hypothetical protein M1823_002367 [Watsoniomyces obsoletus]|nr:MAG: hypothetical protein M1823_002367 [Watsoniomyces obsoletus]